MNKKSFKEQFVSLLNSSVDNLSKAKKIKLVKDYLIEEEKNDPYDKTNKNKPYTDDELKIILSFSPTKENSLKLAKCFKRGFGSIEQIFRWAIETDANIRAKGRDKDAFIMQIKRIYKEIGWRS